jgi:hypothetical protein
VAWFGKRGGRGCTYSVWRRNKSPHQLRRWPIQPERRHEARRGINKRCYYAPELAVLLLRGDMTIRRGDIVINKRLGKGRTALQMLRMEDGLLIIVDKSCLGDTKHEVGYSACRQKCLLASLLWHVLWFGGVDPSILCRLVFQQPFGSL